MSFKHTDTLPEVAEGEATVPAGSGIDQDSPADYSTQPEPRCEDNIPQDAIATPTAASEDVLPSGGSSTELKPEESGALNPESMKGTSSVPLLQESDATCKDECIEADSPPEPKDEASKELTGGRGSSDSLYRCLFFFFQ